MDKIIFKGSISFGDFKAYNMYHVKNRYIRKLIILFCAYSILFYIFAHTYFNILQILLLSAGMSLLAEGALIMIFFKRIGAIYNSSARIKNEFIYEASNEGIKCTSDNSNNFVKWNEIITASEYRKVIMLYTSLNQAFILPYRFFKSESDIEKLKKIIKDKISAEKVKL